MPSNTREPRTAAAFAAAVFATTALAAAMLGPVSCTPRPRVEAPPPPPQPLSAPMPDVTGTDLDATARQFVDAGVRVTVIRPAQIVPHVSDPDAEPFLLPEIVAEFEPGIWTHLIAEQLPPPDIVIEPSSLVTLTAGVHHGAGPFRPWVEAHAEAIAERGDDRCADCHTAEYCAECHDAVGVSPAE